MALPTSDVLRDQAIAQEIVTTEQTLGGGAGIGTSYYSDAETAFRTQQVLNDLRGGANTPATSPVGTPLPTWDQMSPIQKLGTYVTQVIPRAVADTAGLTEREGAQTPVSVVSSAASRVASGLSLGAPYILLGLGLLAVIVVFRAIR